MQYRQLGQAGVRVSTIGLGSYLTIGMSIDQDTGRATFRKAVELGINFFDTADAYNQGKAEEALGQYLKEVRRQDVVLASKAFAPMSDNPNDRGLSAKHLFEGCHNSLRRLHTDYLDLYQCHRPDSSVPLAETVTFACGPQVMLKFAAGGLMLDGQSPHDIYVSLERRMECGVAQCGHCQIGAKFVCKDGPVFALADIKRFQDTLL